MMQVNLHANAATTPKTRAYIQSGNKPVAVLAKKLGVKLSYVFVAIERTTRAVQFDDQTRSYSTAFFRAGQRA